MAYTLVGVMSEFFKALEQAERDRAREEQAEGAQAPRPDNPARVAPPAMVKTATVEPPPVTHTEPPVTRATAEPAGVKDAPNRVARNDTPARPVAAEPAVARPSTPPPPAVSKSVPKRRAAANPPPPSVSQVSSPATVFRPSLRVPRHAPAGRRLNGRHPLLITLTDPHSIAADAFRTVRANIELMAEGQSRQLIAITSAAGGDGKSTSAANLAAVAAQGGRRVCLVDADVRRGRRLAAREEHAPVGEPRRGQPRAGRLEDAGSRRPRLGRRVVDLDAAGDGARGGVPAERGDAPVGQQHRGVAGAPDDQRRGQEMAAR